MPVKRRSERGLMDGTNKFTLLDNAVPGFGGAVEGGGSEGLTDGGSSLGYVAPAANAAACLAYAKAPPKP